MKPYYQDDRSWPPPGIKPYYADSSAVIIHGDCREILPHLPPVDLVLTDPPYGISHSSNYTAPSTTAKWMNTVIQNDNSVAARDAVLAGFAEWVCFGSYRAPPPPGYRGVLVWDKGPASGMGDLAFPWKLSWELIFLAGTGWSGDRDEGVLKNMHIVTRASMGRMHPNEKPVDLIQYLIGKHTAQTILDPFMGSGTTLVAAKNLGRKSIGIEIEEKYCAIAAERLSQGVLPLGDAA